MDQDICQATVFHQDLIAAARTAMPAADALAKMADLFKLLGDGSRLRLLQALATTEMCVCDLAALLESTPSAVSHQLRLLRTAGLVRCRRDGKMAFYSLAAGHLRSLLAEGGRYVAAREK